MENLLNHENRGKEGLIEKQKMVDGSIDKIARKKLSDITNIQHEFEYQSKDRNVICISMEHVEKLQKENAGLVRLLAERNKIIELSGTEIQKLRINLQKLNQQNRQLAQENSQMLAVHSPDNNSKLLSGESRELNMSKDKLRALQHEHGCTLAMLKVKNLKLEEKTKFPHLKVKQEDAGTSKYEELNEITNEPKNKDKACMKKRPSKISTLCPPKAPMEKENDRRKSLRRQSRNFKDDEPKDLDLVKINDSHEDQPVPIKSPLICDQGPCIKIENEDYSQGCIGKEEKPPRRSSMGRPLRQAVEKVNTYKEPTLKVKMRRVE